MMSEDNGEPLRLSRSITESPLLDEKKIVFDGLHQISENIQRIVQEARADIERGVDNFVTKNVGKLFAIVGIYKAVFERLCVASKLEFEKKASQYFRDARIRDQFEEFLQNEDHIGTAGGRVLIVSFGQQDGAQKWLQDTGCSFDMVLDSERNIYVAFGLTRSVFKVWSIACMTYYAEQVVAGRELPKPYENVHDDPQQMGGDFILDSEGILRLSYCSKTASDRPSVDHLISVMNSGTARVHSSQD